MKRTVNCLALNEVGIVLAGQQAVPIAANNALNVSKRVNNGRYSDQAKI